MASLHFWLLFSCQPRKEHVGGSIEQKIALASCPCFRTLGRRAYKLPRCCNCARLRPVTVVCVEQCCSQVPMSSFCRFLPLQDIPLFVNKVFLFCSVLERKEDKTKRKHKGLVMSRLLFCFFVFFARWSFVALRVRLLTISLYAAPGACRYKLMEKRYATMPFDVVKAVVERHT